MAICHAIRNNRGDWIRKPRRSVGEGINGKIPERHESESMDEMNETGWLSPYIISPARVILSARFAAGNGWSTHTYSHKNQC
jgi:hypothetical protein